jgi:hypothetical protein
MDKKTEEQKDIVAGVFGGTDVVTTEDMQFDGPSGFDGVDNECITIPFLKMAQSGTDEAKKGSPKYVQGLEPGQFFCPATRKVYGETARLVILRFYRQYVIYESREPDSKFMGTMSPEQFKTAIEPHATRERSFHLDSEGHRYVDTRNFIVMVANAINDGPMLLSLSSTGISPSKKWMTQAQNVRDNTGRVAPIWANVWEVSTGYMDNPQGSYYQISRISRLGYVSPKIRDVVVNAFLDAQGAGSHELEQNFAKAAPEDGIPVDGTHEESELY